MEEENLKTEHDRMYELLTILQSYAPNRDAQAYCAATVNQMGADGIPLREQAAYLAASIADGLRHGSWPWLIRDMRAARRDLSQHEVTATWVNPDGSPCDLEELAREALENLKKDIPPETGN